MADLTGRCARARSPPSPARSPSRGGRWGETLHPLLHVMTAAMPLAALASVPLVVAAGGPFPSGLPIFVTGRSTPQPGDAAATPVLAGVLPHHDFAEPPVWDELQSAYCNRERLNERERRTRR